MLIVGENLYSYNYHMVNVLMFSIPNINIPDNVIRYYFQCGPRSHSEDDRNVRRQKLSLSYHGPVSINH